MCRQVIRVTFPTPKHLVYPTNAIGAGATDSAGSPYRRAAILHSKLAGIQHLSFLLAFDAICQNTLSLWCVTAPFRTFLRLFSPGRSSLLRLARRFFSQRRKLRHFHSSV